MPKTVIVVVVVMVVLVGFAMTRWHTDYQECKKLGGVMVKTDSGHVCAKLEVLRR